MERNNNATFSSAVVFFTLFFFQLSKFSILFVNIHSLSLGATSFVLLLFLPVNQAKDTHTEKSLGFFLSLSFTFFTLASISFFFYYFPHPSFHHLFFFFFIFLLPLLFFDKSKRRNASTAILIREKENAITFFLVP